MTSPLPPLSALDLFRIAFVGDPRISPDGKTVVHTVKRARLEDNRYQINLYSIAAGGGEARPLTHGDQIDTLPRWSPDGRTLAFVSNRHQKRDQVYLLPMDGGEARRLTSLDGPISALEWSPDGTRLVLVSRLTSEEQKARREAEEKGERGKRTSFQVHRVLHFKEDGLGFLFDSRAHLYRVDAVTGESVQLTDGEVDDLQPVFSPDGKWIAFASNRAADPDTDLDNLDICLVPAAGGDVRRLTTGYGPNVAPAFSPDGKTVAFVGAFVKDRGDSFWRDLHLWTVPTAGGEPREITPNLDRTVGNVSISDCREVGQEFEAPVWSPDGKSLTFVYSDSGSAGIARVAAAGGEVERLTPLGRELSGLSRDAQGGRIAFLVSDQTHPAEVAVIDPHEGGEPRVLTAHNRELLAERWVGTPEEAWIPTAPGVQVHGWVLKPHRYQEGKRYPAILEIHGGPHMQYANTFFHEIQHLAGKGFLVMWTNPRGSHGYGEAHTKAIQRHWGEVDYEDLMKVADHLAARKDVDPARMGVTGGSYGGYMTNWIVGHTDRFRAAATQRSVVNLYSFFGESDFGYHFQYEFHGLPWEDEETALKYLRMSPIHYVKNVTTPLLILHSDEDHRCPISQAEELYTALKVLDREVEFVRFEGESHGLSRGGRPKNRLERLRRIGDWFDRHLEPEAPRK